MSEPELPDLLPEELTRRAASGAAVLAARQLLATVVTLVGGVWLARLLAPADFGYYAVALLILSVSTTIGEGGVAASIVREHSTPTEAELRTAFSFQALVTATIAVMGFALAPFLRDIGLSDAGTRLISLALLSPVFASFKSVPTIRLERELRFGVIGGASAIEVVTFNVVAVALAANGHGVISLGVGLVAGAVLGATWMLVASPWRPRLGLSGDLRRHLRFGVPYQGVAAISVVKDSISPLLIGLVAGAAGVGYAEWAQRFAAYALIALFIVQRLLLTWFARLQHDRARLETAVRGALTVAYGLVAPVSLVSLLFARPITTLVFGAKWEPGLVVFWWLWLANLFVPAAVVAMAGLNALGFSRLAFRFALLWMTLTWAFGLPLITWLGIGGYGIANALVQISNFWLFSCARQRFAFPWLRTAVYPWVASAVAAVPAWLVWRLGGAASLLPLLAACATLGVVYGVIVLGHPEARQLLRRSIARGGR